MKRDLSPHGIEQRLRAVTMIDPATQRRDRAMYSVDGMTGRIAELSEVSRVSLALRALGERARAAARGVGQPILE